MKKEKKKYTLFCLFFIFLYQFLVFRRKNKTSIFYFSIYLKMCIEFFLYLNIGICYDEVKKLHHGSCRN
jgi:hypothetical protein